MNEISFMPEYMSKLKVKRQKFIKFIIMIMGLLVILRTAFYIPSIELRDLTDYKIIVEREYSKLQNKNINIKIDLEKRSKAIEVIMLKNKKLGGVFKNFNKYLTPPNIVDNIKLDYKGISLSGRCLDYFSIIKLVSNIEKSKLYKSINISSIEYNKDLNIFIYAINITQLE